jgi:hypothetical protein
MTDELYDWQKVFELKGQLVQRDVTAFEGALFKQPLATIANLAKNNNMRHGAILKAAIEAGWIVAPVAEVGDFDKGGKKERRWMYDGKNVDDMHPGAVRWLGAQIDSAYEQVTSVPKNL